MDISLDAFLALSPLFVILLIFFGSLSGFLAGLLGVGGGFVTTPALLLLYNMIGYDGPDSMHVCVGTSLLIIVFNGISSARAHWKRGVVDTDFVLRLGGGAALGTVGGALLASKIDSETLMVVFACAVLFFAFLMARDLTLISFPKAFFSRPVNVIYGAMVGCFSSLIGIGGSVFNVPYMSAAGLDIRRAIGTGAMTGIFISLPASIGFMVIGQGVEGLPAFSFGYVNMLVVAIIVPFSMLCAPLGVRVSHAIDRKPLRLGFAAFMVLVSMKMWFEIL